MTVKLKRNLHVGPVNIFLIFDSEYVHCGYWFSMGLFPDT